MAKRNKDYYLRFFINEKIYLRLAVRHMLIFYQIDDNYHFLNFDIENKEFEESPGFGKKDKNPDPSWWRKYSWKWEEI